MLSAVTSQPQPLPSPETQGLAHFPPERHLFPALPPCHPGGLGEGLQHPLERLAPRPPPCCTCLPSSVPLPVLDLRDLPEKQGDQCQSDLWASGEAHPGRRKKMAEPSFPQSCSEHGRRRRLAARLGPTLITGRARKPAPPSPGLRVCSWAAWGDPWPDPSSGPVPSSLSSPGEVQCRRRSQQRLGGEKGAVQPSERPGHLLPTPCRKVPAWPRWPRWPADLTWRPPCPAGRPELGVAAGGARPRGAAARAARLLARPRQTADGRPLGPLLPRHNGPGRSGAQ